MIITNHPNWVKSNINCNLLFPLRKVYRSVKNRRRMRNNATTKKKRRVKRGFRKPLHQNKTIMCHVIKNKTQASLPPTLKVNMDTQCRVIICLFFECLYRPAAAAAACMASVWFSQEQYWGKPWMKLLYIYYSSILLSQIFKDCQHHESISLYNVHNYRALVQRWEVERRH